MKQVYETICKSEIWRTSALIVLFDEHGGFYDHEPAPGGATPPGDEPRYTDWGNSLHSREFAWDQYGLRVPALVISPLVPAGAVDDRLYDHTSIIATVAKRFSLGRLTNRDANALTFDDLFSLPEVRQTRRNLPDVIGPRNFA